MYKHRKYLKINTTKSLDERNKLKQRQQNLFVAAWAFTEHSYDIRF